MGLKGEERAEAGLDYYNYKGPYKTKAEAEKQKRALLKSDDGCEARISGKRGRWTIRYLDECSHIGLFW